MTALAHVWPVIALFVLVIGGIYVGAFTATEGAGIGAGGAFLFALARRALTWRMLLDVLIESARTTSMLFMILIGALLFANFVNYTTMPADLKSFVTQFDVHPALVIAAICLIYVAARHGHGGAVDDPPHRAAVLPGGHRRWATTRSGSASWW